MSHPKPKPLNTKQTVEELARKLLDLYLDGRLTPLQYNFFINKINTIKPMTFSTDFLDVYGSALKLRNSTDPNDRLLGLSLLKTLYSSVGHFKKAALPEHYEDIDKVLKTLEDSIKNG